MKIYAAKEAADFLGIGLKKLYEKLEQNQIDCVRNPIRITQTALDNYLGITGGKDFEQEIEKLKQEKADIKRKYEEIRGKITELLKVI